MSEVDIISKLRSVTLHLKSSAFEAGESLIELSVSAAFDMIGSELCECWGGENIRARFGPRRQNGAVHRLV